MAKSRKKADSYPKAQECHILELKGSCKVIPSNSLHPVMNPPGAGKGGAGRPTLPTLERSGGHQGTADPSLPRALFPILNPLIGRKFSLASNLNRSCATVSICSHLCVQGQENQLCLYDTMTIPRFHLSLSSLILISLFPFSGPG